MRAKWPLLAVSVAAENGRQTLVASPVAGRAALGDDRHSRLIARYRAVGQPGQLTSRSSTGPTAPRWRRHRDVVSPSMQARTPTRNGRPQLLDGLAMPDWIRLRDQIDTASDRGRWIEIEAGGGIEAAVGGRGRGSR